MPGITGSSAFADDDGECRTGVKAPNHRGISRIAAAVSA
jgi:hypothetical protein